MKKFKNYLLLCLLTLSLGFAFTACGDDDDDPSYDAAALVGTWKATAYYGYEKTNGVIDWESESVEDCDTEIIEFKDNGTAVAHIDEYKFNLIWRIQGNQIITTDSEGQTGKSTILTLNSTTLVVESYDKYSSEGSDNIYEDYEKRTYTRVK